MAGTLEQEMFNYFIQLNEAEKKSVVQMLKTFLKGRRTPEHNISLEQYNKEIDEAIARVQAGDFFTQEQVEEMAKDF